MGLKGAEGDMRIKVKKEKTAGKICSNDLNCLQIYVLFCVSLYINPSGCKDSTNVTAVRLRACMCVFICVCIAAHFYSSSACSLCLLQSKLTSEFCRKHSPVVRQHPPTSKHHFIFFPPKAYLPCWCWSKEKRFRPPRTG